MLADNLETCCLGLDSSKVTERRKCAENLKEYLDRSDILAILNCKNRRPNWDFVYISTHRYIRKESEKLSQDEVKRVCKSASFITRIRSYSELLKSVLSKASLGTSHIKVSMIIETCFECFNSINLKKFFGDIYVSVLIKYVLGIPQHFVNIDNEKWRCMFLTLKDLYKRPCGIDKHNILHAVYLTIKNGVVYSALNLEIRNEFPFFKEICLPLKNKTNSSPQNDETILRLLTVFSAEVSVECRMASCKLGEEISRMLVEMLYYNLGGKKNLIFDYLLLQMSLHHPFGAEANSDAAYAFNWDIWKPLMSYLYSALCNEVEYILRQRLNTENIPILEANFLQLFVDVAKQVFHSGILDVTKHNILDCSLPMSKKPKLEIGVSTLVRLIHGQDNKWSWLCILSRLIDCYPETIEASQFLPLLETSATLQAESKCFVTRHYLYELLTQLVTLQNKFDSKELDLERVDALWQRIWETSLRSAGLNQNEQSTHKHLQAMLQHKKVLQPLTLLSLYSSGVLNLSKYSLETFFTLCTMVPLPETFTKDTDLNIRQYMIKNIMETVTDDTSCILSTIVMEKILAGLVMKVWPYQQNFLPILAATDKYKRRYEAIEDCLKMTAFDMGLLFKQTESQKIKVKCLDNKNILVYSEKIFKQLLQQLDSFILNTLSKNNPTSCPQIVELFNAIRFILRVYSELIIEGLLPVDYITSNNQNIGNVLSKLYVTLQTPKYLADLSILEEFESLLKLELHSSVGLIVRDAITVKLLEICFDLWNIDQVNGSDDMDTMEEENSNSFSNVALSVSSLNTNLIDEKSLTHSEKRKLVALRILVHYTCVRDVDSITQNQKHAIESLLLTDINPLSNIDFQAMVYLLNGLMNCKIGLLPKENIESMLNIVESLIESRFQECEASIVLLQILKDFIPHANGTASDELKSKLLRLLFIFFDNSKLYGPLVCVKIADCCGELFKKFNNMENTVDVATKLLELLNYGNHEVRLAVVTNIVHVFRVYSNTTKAFLKQQNEIFTHLNQKVEESFTLNYKDNTCQELLIDEAANRTASALHMYSSLITASTFWRKKALLFLMYLVANKQFKTEYLHKVLTIVAEYLNVKNVSVFLNDHLNYLICQWSKSSRSVFDFPFQLFECKTLVKFLTNNLQSVIPVLFEIQSDGLLENVCKEMNKSIPDILKEFYPNLIVQYLPVCLLANSSITHQISANDIQRNQLLFKQLNDATNSDGLFTLLSQSLDDILIQLLYRFFDCEHFQKQFGFLCVLSETDPPFYSHELFSLTLQFIESKVLNNVSIIKHCINKSPNKLERVVFQMTTNLLNTKATLEEKLLSLHRYSILVDYIVTQFETNNDMNKFLIRSIVTSLISVIQLNFNQAETEILSIAACKYFKIFVTNSLPFNSNIFEELLMIVVSSLVPIAKLTSKVSTECIDILRLLIVSNSKHLYSGISALDPFPTDITNQKFAEIQVTYEKTKYGNEIFTLEQEIRHFLRVGYVLDLCDRTEGLRHLRKELSLKKNELLELYTKLNGFRGNIEPSILHQLICMLVHLTKSPISDVRIEAAGCLGELGPSDLTTLVLKAEKPVPKIEMEPVEIVTGEILVLLTRYLFLPDVDVISTVTDALYAIINSETGIFLANNRTTSIFDSGILEQHFIFPFLISLSSTSPINLNFNAKQFCLNLDDYNLWSPVTTTLHSEWITTFVCKLLESFPETHSFRTLLAVCRVKVQFAEKLLPLLIFLIVMQQKKNCIEIITRQINGFFAKHWRGTIEKGSYNLKNIVFNHESVQCMLNVVHYVRLQLNHFQTSISKILKLNFLYVAQAAQFCGAHFTSILYAELWCYSKLEEKPYDIENKSSIIEVVCNEESSEMTFAFENLLREGYKQIGDMDAVYGCGTSYILNTKSRIEYYKNISRWDKVLLFHNREEQKIPVDLTKSLKNNGLHWLASKIPSEDVNLQFECAWRLSNWSFSSSEGNTFERKHFQALKLQQEQDFGGMNINIREASDAVISSVSHASLEASKSLYLALSHLRMLQDIENFAKARINQENRKLHDLLTTWRDIDFDRNAFEYIEPIKAQQITMLKDSVVLNNFEEARGLLVDFYLKLASQARIESSYHHVAQQCLDNASVMEGLSEEMRGKLLFEQAQLSWLDDKTSGRYLLKYLLDNNQSIQPLLHGMALNQYGNWMGETRSENPTSIIENYFVKSISVLEDAVKKQSVKDTEILCDALNSLARFADQQYQKVKSYIESSNFQSKIEIMGKFRRMATKIKNPENTKDEIRAIAMYDRQSKIDESEINCAHKERESYLTLAVQNYFRILKYSDSYNLQLFRIFSMSLENKTNPHLLKILEEILPQIASYKYIPLLPQLVPHIGNNNSTQIDTFETIIQSVLERCSLDHPHHTLPIILALADSYKDRNFDPNANCETVEKRVQLAKELINRLKKRKTLTKIIQNMEQMSTALVSLAYVDASKCTKSTRGYTVPRNEPIKSIRNFDNVLLPTINLAVRKNSVYNGIVGVQQFSVNFSLVGGINAPKRIVCCGTDGIQRTQLVKGKDDLRQDAVMQQVFFILNNLLFRNKQTRKLFIRTYKVVPLSQRSGVLEWCENTEPLGTYLTEAHREYHPNEWSPNECRAHLRNFHSKDHVTKYREYKKICAHFRPIFHMFFISAYPQPTEWFERRRAYMHSVATSSMVGYILGLGDRHVQNILLDKNTAEVIHIDFGIAFEQGKCLPTPETVPFRLTRDIEAGMGICGIEGVFRRSCEKTMHVLRQNAETVVTILQVLLYDPLYVWTITPAEAYSRQKDDEDRSINFSDEDASNINTTAERVLLRLREKLQGMENGAICSIEGQVELLVQQARDPANLSRLFNGWQPYL